MRLGNSSNVSGRKHGPRRSRRSHIFAVAVASSLTLVAAGCGSATSARQTSTGRKTTITWLGVANSPAQHNFWASVAAQVPKHFPNISVNLVSVGFTNYFPKLESDISGGSNVCLAQMQSLRMPQYHDLFLPLNGLIKQQHFPIENYNPSIVKGLSYNGKILNLPFDTGPYLLFYNKTMFRKAGLSDPTDGWTISTLMADFAALKAHGFYGIAAAPQPGNWLPFAASAYGGAQPATPSGKLTLDTPSLVDTLKWYGSLVHKYHYSPVVPGVALSNINYPEDQFTSGNVALFLGGPWNIPTGKAAAGFPHFGLVSMPTQTGGVPVSVTAGSGFGITKNCANPEKAFKALSVLIGPAAQKATGVSGWGYPALISAQSAYYKDMPPGVQSVLSYLAPKEQPRLVTDKWATISNSLALQTVEVLNSGTSAAQVLKSVQAQYGG